LTSPKIGRFLFYLILVGYAFYTAVYIYQTSFIISGERYFVLFDDAMISMRYARNLANGYGLVWNPGGARVEGFTNPLWVILMAILHLFPLPASKISLLVQICGAIFLIANLFFANKIARLLTGSWLVALLSVILTAFYAPLNNWGLQGMEVSVLTLIVSASVWIVLENIRSNRFSIWLYLILGVGTLVRIDMAVVYLVIMTFLVFADRSHRRQNLIWGIGFFILFIMSQTLFRWIYYGDILPNTYYLKMQGYPVLLRLIHGDYVLFRFIWRFNWLLFLLPFIVLAFRRDRAILLPVLVILAQLAYSVYVGGDAWEHRGGSNRYISIVMPIYFIRLCSRSDPSDPFQIQPRVKYPLLSQTFCCLVCSRQHAPLNLLVDFKSLQRWALLRQPIFIEGNKVHTHCRLLTNYHTPSNIAVVSRAILISPIVCRCPCLVRMTLRSLRGRPGSQSVQPG
jgi:hypothetical protein